MSAEELTDLVLEVYQARKEAKEYLEFYLNPDIDAKLSKVKETVTKELTRVSRRKYAPRISNIKAAVKLFRSYGPDEEMICGLMTEIFEAMAVSANTHYFGSTYINGCGGFLKETLKEINRAALFSIYFPRLVKAVDSVRTDHWDSRNFRSAMKEIIETGTL